MSLQGTPRPDMHHHNVRLGHFRETPSEVTWPQMPQTLRHNRLDRTLPLQRTINVSRVQSHVGQPQRPEHALGGLRIVSLSLALLNKVAKRGFCRTAVGTMMHIDF